MKEESLGKTYIHAMNRVTLAFISKECLHSFLTNEAKEELDFLERIDSIRKDIATSEIRPYALDLLKVPSKKLSRYRMKRPKMPASLKFKNAAIHFFS